MKKIIYKDFEVLPCGKGKHKRLSIVGVFHDQARPEKIIKYTLTGIKKAIIQRELEKQEVAGLKIGRDAILNEYQKRGIEPPISRAERSRLKIFQVASLK